MRYRFAVTARQGIGFPGPAACTLLTLFACMPSVAARLMQRYGTVAFDLWEVVAASPEEECGS